MRLEGHVAIVTGVSHAGQVGYALAAAFARVGAHLAISARSAKPVHARAEELRGAGAQVIAVPADLTTEEGANTLVQEKLAHRDIKPENMLLGRSDEILLSDFGIANMAQRSGQLLRASLGKSAPPLNVIVTAHGEVSLKLPVFQSGEVPVLFIPPRIGVMN
jgi:NAD(P)-dependent dehydrogenase (short-subunit alcohol dehydrogenase family)